MRAIAVSGRFTKDGEIRTTKNGHHILSFGIAENVYMNGEEQTQFFNCQLFGNRAEKLAPYIRKGGAATVFGSLQIRKYTDRQGFERQSIEIIVGDITLQGSSTDRQQAQPRQPPTPQQSDIDDDVPY